MDTLELDKVVHLDKAMIEEFRRKKLLSEQLKSVDLDPIGPGETMIGILTEEERLVFTEMASLRNDIDLRLKELTARSLEMFAAAVRKSDKPNNIPENIDETLLFPTDEEAREHFALETRFEYLRAVYNSSIRDRYGHENYYGVRTGFTVVRLGSKYKTPSELRHGIS